MADLSTGADAVGGERWANCEYNDIKNHWRMSDPCTNLTAIQAGMIVSDSDDEKLYHRWAAACGEIVQGDVPLSDEVAVIVGANSDGKFYYDEATNDEVVIEARAHADTEGVTINLLEANQQFRIRQNSDVISIYHDGTDANLVWTDTDLNILPPAGGKVTIDGGANNLTAGLDIRNLGTATMGIDLSNSGLSGSSDYWLYGAANNYLRADGKEFSMSDGTVIGKLIIPTAIPSVQFGSVSSHPFTISQAGVVRAIITQPRAAFLYGNAVQIGSLTNCTSNGTATITKVAHGLAVANGDLIHITDATTAADKRFYRLVSFTADTLVVDRALAGADADVDLTAYQDVILISQTDGTNGQRIMNYSHQDKPLQIGGDTLQATAGLGSEDVVLGGITGYTRVGAYYNWTYQGDVADDGSFTLPAFTDACWGFVQFGNNEEYAFFTVDDDGDVTLISNSANIVANADTDTNGCIGTAATQEPLVIKNRLGAQKNINLIIWYS